MVLTPLTQSWRKIPMPRAMHLPGLDGCPSSAIHGRLTASREADRSGGEWSQCSQSPWHRAKRHSRRFNAHDSTLPPEAGISEHIANSESRKMVFSERRFEHDAICNLDLEDYH